MNIEDAKKKLDQSNIGNLYNSAKGIMNGVSKAASGTMSGSVAEAIKNAGAQDVEEKLTQVKESSDQTKQLLQEAKAEQQAGSNAAIQPEEEQEDGLQRMIREAQIQTDQLVKPKGLLGGDEALAGAGQKLLQTTALQGQATGVPMAGSQEEEEPWVDTSYLTPIRQLEEQGKQMQGAWVDPKAGTYVQHQNPDGSYEQIPWIYERDGTAIHVQHMTEAEIQELIRQAQDDTFTLTGRVYKPNADGSTPQWLRVGDQVVTAGGTYVITGHNRSPKAGESSYYSMLLDPNQTTETYQGNYNTGTYGSIIGEQNGFKDDFKGIRGSNGEYTGYGGYSINKKTGQSQFDTVAFTFDDKWTRSVIVEGVPYKWNYDGELEPLEAGSLIQDASERYWVIGADGKPIDVTPENPMNNPINDPTGVVAQIQRQEAKKAGLDLDRSERSSGGSSIDPVTQAQIAQLEAQLAREKAATEAANRDLYRQYRLGQEKLSDQLVGAGLVTTGANEKAHADLTAEYLAAANANRQGMRTEEEDVAWQIQAATLQAQQEAQAQRQQEAQQRAATLAQYGDFSGYSELGYSPAQISGMKASYDAQNAPDTTYGGLSDYTVTLLELYQANPRYDIKAGLQEALQSGLISQQDYLAGLQMASGLAV